MWVGWIAGRVGTDLIGNNTGYKANDPSNPHDAVSNLRLPFHTTGTGTIFRQTLINRTGGNTGNHSLPPWQHPTDHPLDPITIPLQRPHQISNGLFPLFTTINTINRNIISSRAIPRLDNGIPTPVTRRPNPLHHLHLIRCNMERLNSLRHSKSFREGCLGCHLLVLWSYKQAIRELAEGERQRSRYWTS
jgi:hypothetical protein